MSLPIVGTKKLRVVMNDVFRTPWIRQLIGDIAPYRR